LNLNSDYYNFTKIHQTTLETAFKFLGAPERSMALEMLKHELIVYGLHSEVEHGINQDTNGMFTTSSLSRLIITTQQRYKHILIVKNSIRMRKSRSKTQALMTWSPYQKKKMVGFI